MAAPSVILRDWYVFENLDNLYTDSSLEQVSEKMACKPTRSNAQQRYQEFRKAPNPGNLEVNNYEDWSFHLGFCC